MIKMIESGERIDVIVNIMIELNIKDNLRLEEEMERTKPSLLEEILSYTLSDTSMVLKHNPDWMIQLLNPADLTDNSVKNEKEGSLWFCREDGKK